MPPTDVVLSETDIVQPDLVVEILSESTRKVDEITKRKLYEQFGILEYWIIDPVLETVRIYRMTPSGYLKFPDISMEDNSVLTTPLLPDLQIPLSEIFE